jgi:Homeodomain-like domain
MGRICGFLVLTVADSETIILGLQDEIRRSEESRYDHRLHGLLLVAQGMTCPEVAGRLGDAPRTVEYWIHQRFEMLGPRIVVLGVALTLLIISTFWIVTFPRV